MKLLKHSLLLTAFAVSGLTSCGSSFDDNHLSGDVLNPLETTCNVKADRTKQFRLAFNRLAKEDERIRCFESAVRGVGESTARELVEGKHLGRAPSSWIEFKAMMKSLEGRGFDGLYDNTVQRYGSDNAQIFFKKNDDSKKIECRVEVTKREQLRLAFNTHASDPERVRCLQLSVRGVGETTAKDLIQNKDLHHVPANWQQFKRQMRSLEEKGYSEIYNNTVERYGRDNAKIFE